MRGFHFFAALPTARKSKNKTKSAPGWTRAYIKTLVDAGEYLDCVAVFSDRSLSRVSRGVAMRECIASVTDALNSPVCVTAASQEWLDTCATRIDEATARAAHPALFKYLDANIKDE